jgi:hypothetical protein
MTDPAVEDGGPRPMPPVRDTTPPPQAPPAPPPQPLGAHNDLTHPGGPLRPLPPVRDAAPAPGGPKDGGSVGLGVLLAFLWVVASVILTTAYAGILYDHPAAAAALQVVSLVLVLGSAVAIHVYAIRRRKPRVLVGFWGAIVVGVLVFVVSCFAIVWVAFN